MADHSFGNIALCALPQTGFGAQNATIAALTATANTANGLIVGSGDTGEGNSGIDMPEHERIGKELARIGNSAQADSFLRDAASGLAITFPLGGARNTVGGTPADADFDLSQTTIWPGMDAVLRGAGLTGAAWGTGIGWEYKPSGDVTPISIGVWFGGVLVVYKDVLVELELDFPPSDIATAKASFTIGSVHSWATQALSTLTTGNQSIACPVVKSAAHAFGATRPFESLAITVSPDVEESPDSNSSTGLRVRQNGVNVTAAGVFYAATSDPDYEHDNLVLPSATATDLTFGIGSASVSVPANSYALELNNAVVRKASPRKLGSYLGWEAELEGKAITTSGTEFTLRFF